jgi:hypothetical protein
VSSLIARFQVGEQVSYPQVIFSKNGKHEVVTSIWRIQTIFPVSQIALIKQRAGRRGTCVQVPLAQLAHYN